MRSLASVVVVLALPLVARADDWAQFRGPARDGRSAETGLAQQWPEDGPPKLWVTKKLGGGYSSACVVGERVYVTGALGGQGRLTCLGTDGSVKWTAPCGMESTDRKSYPGARSTPTHVDGRVYIYSGLGQMGCWDAATGKPLWTVDTRKVFKARTPSFSIAESPLVVADAVICTPGGKAATVVALHRVTGKTLWAAALGDKPAYCSPVLIERGGKSLVVTWLAKTLVALDAKTGKPVWQARHGNSSGMHANSPLFRASDGLLFVAAGYGFGMLALKVGETGRQQQLRRDRAFDVMHGGMVLVGDHVYGAASSRPGKRWVCLDPLTARARWVDRGVGPGSIIAADGRLYCYGERGTLALVDATPDRYRERGSVRIKDGSGEHWAHPAISGGRLYVRRGGALIAFDIRAAKR